MIKTEVPASLAGLSTGLDFIESTLGKYRFKHKAIQEAMLLSEESMVRLIQNSSENMSMQISIHRHHGIATITLSAPGTDIQSAPADIDINLADSDMGRDSEFAIREILLRAYGDKIKYARKGEYNFIKVTAVLPERAFAGRTLAAFFSALLIGMLLKFLLPDAAENALNTYLLSPIQTIFINTLKLTTAPAIFFSIITSIAQYSSFSDPGRVSIKVFVGYITTSIMAVLVGLGAFRLFLPGTVGTLSVFASQTASSAPVGGETVVNTIVGVVPSNIIDPFLHNNTLQLIFLALICGIALGRIGDYSSSLRGAADALDTLCTKAAEILSGVVPIVTFFSTISLMLNIGFGSLLSLAEMVGVLLIALCIMMLIYFLILVSTGISPITFIKKYAPAMWNNFLLGSSIAALPKTLRCCRNSLGISPKVYSFSIPFGAMVNMDGNCIYLTIAGLFLARLFGVELLGSDVLPLIFSVVVLSIGAPLSSGNTLLCLVVLLSQMGVSLTSLSLLFGLNGIIEMLLAASDTAGDVAISLAVAKTEDLLDMDIYTDCSVRCR